jgi:hypothetical protein
MTQKLEKQIQEIHVTNKNVTQGKKNYVLGTGLALVVAPILPIIDYANEFSRKIDPSIPDVLFKDANFSLKIGGVIFGIGCISAVVGRVKHWYYNDRL